MQKVEQESEARMKRECDAVIKKVRQETEVRVKRDTEECDAAIAFSSHNMARYFLKNFQKSRNSLVFKRKCLYNPIRLVRFPEPVFDNLRPGRLECPDTQDDTL